MPGWHERTLDLQKAGDLQVVGLIQEQHPDRCALFQQWHGMDWPVLVDPLNLLGVDRVPFAICLDEAGVVRSINPRGDDFESFMDLPPVEGEAVEREAVEVVVPPVTTTEVDAARRQRADRDVMFHGRLDEAIDAYRATFELEPDDAPTHFRLGVALRMRFERDGDPDDFAGAIEHWGRALDLVPSQYIWRRRIQQYGPRLDKPYSFYDWVQQARADLNARGEVPHPLRTEPGGAEFAMPSRDLDVSPVEEREPDPDARIEAAPDLVRVESVVVPHTGQEASHRIHLHFRPGPGAHWNNEADPMVVWVEAPEGVTLGRRLHRLEGVEAPVSDEVRLVEVECVGTIDRLRGYALVGVCTEDDGTCLYVRVPFETRLSEE